MGNGGLDTSFDGDGKVLTDFPNADPDVANVVFVDGAGRIVAVAWYRRSRLGLLNYYQREVA